jgi:hypothetical protein
MREIFWLAEQLLGLEEVIQKTELLYFEKWNIEKPLRVIYNLVFTSIPRTVLQMEFF